MIIKVIFGFIIVFVIACVIGYFASLVFPDNGTQTQKSPKPSPKFSKNEQVPIDISRMRIGTPDGIVEVTTAEKERKVMRKQLKDKNVIETRPAAKTKKAKEVKKDDLGWIDEIEGYHAMLDDTDDIY